jgi:hypothetical protein
MLTIRIDDVSLNTDIAKLKGMVDYCNKRQWRVLLAVSPTCFSGEKSTERPVPLWCNPLSDFTIFYKYDKAGVPEEVFQWASEDKVALASHGMCHVDHRLLEHAAQEMSIVSSCSIVKTSIFVPPFHKWNTITENVCLRHGIDLIKYEEGWKHFSYNKPAQIKMYDSVYLHTFDATLEQFITYFDQILK